MPTVKQAARNEALRIKYREKRLAADEREVRAAMRKEAQRHHADRKKRIQATHAANERAWQRFLTLKCK